MDEGKDPQAAIYVEEIHEYTVDLGIVPIIKWKRGQGVIRVEVPYDGALMKTDVKRGTGFPVGTVKIINPKTEETESFSVTLQANGSWQEKIKSGRQIEKTAEYELEEPHQQLVSIDGDVLDNLLGVEAEGNANIFGNVDTYQNPLALHLNLWVPDLFTETRAEQLRQIEAMARWGENSRQILMPNISWINFERKLAENLAALANSSGGTIALGIEKNKNIIGLAPDSETRERVLTHVLKAALLSSPPIILAKPIRLQHSPTGRHIYRIEVPQINGQTHKIQNVIYIRRGSDNVKKVEPISAKTWVKEVSSDVFELGEVIVKDEVGVISFKDRENVIILDGSKGVRNLQIGASICALINANQINGQVVVKNLSQSPNGLISSLLKTQIDIEQVLDSEMGKILPEFGRPFIKYQSFGGQNIAIIKVPSFNIPVALYNGQGYTWKKLVREELTIEELFENYHEEGKPPVGQKINLEQATLNSPIRSPETLEGFNFTTGERLAYDVEYQANVWQARSFKNDKDKDVGHFLKLTAPLRHMSLTLNDDGSAITKKPEVTGEIEIGFQDILTSGIEILSEGNEKNEWFTTIPIYKKTSLKLNYIARLNELFRRRTKTSLMRFLIPDVLLDLERVNDLAQVFADMGFRVQEKDMFYNLNDRNDPSAPQRAIIVGISGRGFYDIQLLVGLLCHQSELTRELKYEGWSDSKSTFTSMFDIRIFLSGTGNGVETEIGRLQLELYQTISQRLQHLRAE